MGFPVCAIIMLLALFYRAASLKFEGAIGFARLQGGRHYG